MILSTNSIKMFKSLDVWRGNGIGDGIKEHLLSSLYLAVDCHHQYYEDNLPSGPLCSHAIRSGKYTIDFFQALITHIDDGINMLCSFRLPSKHIMLLVSNKVVHMCDDLFEFCQLAANVNTSHQVITTARYMWVHFKL